MPQYYDLSVNPGTAFASGLMTGYEFVDRIKSRKRALDLEERGLARQDKIDTFNQEMATRQDTRAQSSHDMQSQEFDVRMRYLPQTLQQQVRSGALGIEQAEYQNAALKFENANLPEKWDMTKEAHESSIAAQGQQIAASKEQIAASRDARNLASNQRNSLRDIAGLMLGPGEDPMAAPAMGGPQGQPGAVMTSAQQPGAAPAPAEPAAPTGPIDFSKVPDKPGVLERTRTAMTDWETKRRTENANDFWSTAADPEAGIFSTFPNAPPGVVRKNASQAIKRYEKDRALIPPKLRESWDLTMKNSLEREGKPIPKWLSEPVKPASTQELLADSGITKSVKASDERITNVVRTAAEHAQSGGLPVITQEQVRLQNTQLARMSGQNRLSPKQVEMIVKAAGYGAINFEGVDNFRKYGTPLAPAQPKVIPVSGGALLQYPNGLAFMPTAGAGKTQAEKASTVVDNFAKDFESRIAAGQIDGEKGAGRALASDAIVLLQANASAFQQQTGIRVLDDSGALDVSALSDPAVSRTVLDWTNNVRVGESNPNDSQLAIPNQESAAELIPTNPTGLQPGFVADGYEYIGPAGGTGQSQQDWRPIN